MLRFLLKTSVISFIKGSDEANCTRVAAAPRKSHKVRPALLKRSKFVAPKKN